MAPDSRLLTSVQASAALAAAIATMAGLVALLVSDQPRESPQPAARTSTHVERRLTDTEQKLRDLQAAVRAQGAVPSQGKLAAEVRRTKRRVSVLASDQSDLKAVLAPDPVKALQVALLQRDLKNEQATTRASVEAVRADIERQYDLMKFVVGTLGLGLLAVIASVAVPAIRERRSTAQ